MKKTIILATAMILAANIFADRRSIKDRSDNWLQHENTEESTGGNLRLDTPGGENTIANQTGAVGDLLWLLAGLGIAYGFFTIRKKEHN
ncbi:MAG: hypothetical protein LBS25_02720 [Candidatus Symbiothrix sp.]|jgi:hypothetical protein|nr:hypothetical protein [Candidatus Symbiothrix sp.]